MAKKNSTFARKMRHQRVRKKLSGTAVRPRLCVFRSLNHIYAQIIDDSIGQTLVSVGTLDAQLKGNVEKLNKTKNSEIVGSSIARKALDKGIKTVVFDRGGYMYHGRVKALAESARKEGLLF